MSEVTKEAKSGKKKITQKDVTRWICILLVGLMVLSIVPMGLFMM
jgi:hypothetical protein